MTTGFWSHVVFTWKSNLYCARILQAFLAVDVATGFRVNSSAKEEKKHAHNHEEPSHQEDDWNWPTRQCKESYDRQRKHASNMSTSMYMYMYMFVHKHDCIKCKIIHYNLFLCTCSVHDVQYMYIYIDVHNICTSCCHSETSLKVSSREETSCSSFAVVSSLFVDLSWLSESAEAERTVGENNNKKE